MNDQLLKQIFDELKQVNSRLSSIESGQSELQQITRAIRDRQEKADAKLESLSMDVNKIHGRAVQIEEKLTENLSDIRGDVRFLNHRIADLEMDVEKLKNR
ncbi:hypothetical protein ACM1RC_25885 [Paenibacillus azoreducens]|uniref:hypothetical protein n=1 Tax=Paenibacillus azoreducens TaxID=116718 RepID=UPI0039F5EDFB